MSGFGADTSPTVSRLEACHGTVEEVVATAKALLDEERERRKVADVRAQRLEQALSEAQAALERLRAAAAAGAAPPVASGVKGAAIASSAPAAAPAAPAAPPAAAAKLPPSVAAACAPGAAPAPHASSSSALDASTSAGSRGSFSSSNATAAVAPGAAPASAAGPAHGLGHWHAHLPEDPKLLELSPEGKAAREAKLDRTLLRQMRSEQAHWDGSAYEALIFEGGGTKGMVYAGAIQRLSDAGLLHGISHFAGTSAGAQTAALVAVGYSGNELRRVMIETPWGKLLDSSKMHCFGCIPNVYRLLTRHGWCKGEMLQNHLETLIAKKVGKGKSGKGYTLLELFEERGVILRVGACNITLRRFELLDYTTHPNMPISMAARASSNIPVVFVPMEYQCVRHPEQTFLYVDGGLEGNIPMKSFPGKRTLAFDLMSSGDWLKEHGTYIPPLNFKHFIGIILDMVMNSAQSASGLKEGDDDDQGEATQAEGDVHIVKIHCGNHGMLETHMSEKDVLSLVAAGWDAVQEFVSPPSASA